jgi:uncharacterized sporulation protein YeaH/YhbH (DUF444 family)
MAVEAIGPARTTERTSTAQTELQRFQQRIASELAEKVADKVAARDKAAVVETETDSLRQRQAAGGTLDVGRLGSALDLTM